MQSLTFGCILLETHVDVEIASSLQAKQWNTVKPVLCGHSKIDKIKILLTNGSLMKVESIAECSHSAILLTCIQRKSVLKKQFLVFLLSGC